MKNWKIIYYIINKYKNSKITKFSLLYKNHCVILYTIQMMYAKCYVKSIINNNNMLQNFLTLNLFSTWSVIGLYIVPLISPLASLNRKARYSGPERAFLHGWTFMIVASIVGLTDKNQSMEYSMFEYLQSINKKWGYKAEEKFLYHLWVTCNDASVCIILAFCLALSA